ncbi:MAG: hypothetical protein WD100_13745, partial [Tistlia sp.]
MTATGRKRSGGEERQRPSDLRPRAHIQSLRDIPRRPTGNSASVVPSEVPKPIRRRLEALRLRSSDYNIIVVIMIPALVSLSGSPWTVLPPGAHAASLEDVAAAFGTNAWRRELFDGLVVASGKLRLAGCQAIYLDGSYVTGKPRPGDFDACWDPTGVDPAKLDPVFREFANGRAAQKAAFKGEFFPSSMMCVDVGWAFVDFFQLDRFTGKQKGIISISLLADPLLSG